MFDYMILEMKKDRNNTAGAKALAVIFYVGNIGCGDDWLENIRFSGNRLRY